MYVPLYIDLKIFMILYFCLIFVVFEMSRRINGDITQTIIKLSCIRIASSVLVLEEGPKLIK